MTNIPKNIGKYSITSLIAEGGMGAVYKAVHPTLQRDVIIKKLTLTGNQSFAERFKREARFMMDFRNENIVQVFDHFKEGNSYYIVMEYVDGITLESLIKRDRYLPISIAIMIFTEICQALKHAHDQNILHRDIKPANILISNEGVVKLVDFGVSTSLEESEDEGLTQAGMTIGTPAYLPPEQVSNARNKDLRSDIYSMGVLLYEMTTGKKPYTGGFSPELIHKIEKGKHTSARKINPDITWKLNRIIKKSMHHKINKRFQDLKTIQRKLSAFLHKNINSVKIKEIIKNYIEHPEAAIPDQSNRNKLKFVISGFCILFVLTIVGGSYFYHSGQYKAPLYQYMLYKEYGAFKVNVSLPVPYKRSNEVYFRPTLFKYVNGKLERVPTPLFNFHLTKYDRRIKRMSFISDLVYLPPAHYTLVLYAGNEQFRENFHLNPIGEAFPVKKITPLQIDFSGKEVLPPLPLKFNLTALDITSLKNITEEVKVDIKVGKRWIAWQDFSQNTFFDTYFISGKRYQFRFSLENYYSEKYWVTTRPDQIAFNLTIKMIPYPAIIKIKSDVSDIKLNINESDHYYTWGVSRKRIPIPSIDTQYEILKIAPGKHTFSVKSNGLFWGPEPTDLKTDVKPNQIIHLDIKKDKLNNSLIIEQSLIKEP